MSDDSFFERPARAHVLRCLPEFAPDPALWPRIVSAHTRAETHRRRRRTMTGAAVAAVFVVVVLAGPWQRGSLSDDDGPQAESRTLEGELRRVSGRDGQGSADLHRLRLIDASLQSAYDRGADASEIAPLWQQRNDALKGLISHARTTAGLGENALLRI